MKAALLASAAHLLFGLLAGVTLFLFGPIPALGVTGAYLALLVFYSSPSRAAGIRPWPGITPRAVIWGQLPGLALGIPFLVSPAGWVCPGEVAAFFLQIWHGVLIPLLPLVPMGDVGGLPLHFLFLGSASFLVIGVSLIGAGVGIVTGRSPE